MAEQTIAENTAEEKVENAENRTIFDSVFHTIVQNLPQLLIALINLTFGKDYPTDIEILQLRNEHHHKSGVVTTDCFLLIGEATYHIECQTNPDGTMALRMVEYDFVIAFEEAWQNQSDVIKMPSSCVVCLRHTKNTPDVYRVTILGQDEQRMEYRCPVIKVQNYTLEELFEKNLLMLLPYYIMRYEGKFHDMEDNADLRNQFLAEVTALSDRLEAAVSPDDKTGVYQDLIQLITDIAKYELREYQKTLEGVKKIMEARILPLPSDSLRAAERRGIEQGIQQGIQLGIEKERHTYMDTLNNIFRNLYNKGNSIADIAETTGQAVDTVTSGLRVQGIAV